MPKPPETPTTPELDKDGELLLSLFLQFIARQQVDLGITPDLSIVQDYFIRLAHKHITVLKSQFQSFEAGTGKQLVEEDRKAIIVELGIALGQFLHHEYPRQYENWEKLEIHPQFRPVPNPSRAKKGIILVPKSTNPNESLPVQIRTGVKFRDVNVYFEETIIIEDEMEGKVEIGNLEGLNAEKVTFINIGYSREFVNKKYFKME